MLFEHHSITIDPKQDLYRIDKFLLNRLPNVTRNKIQAAISEGLVLVNGNKVKTSYKVRPGDEVKIMLPSPPRSTEIVPQNIPIDIHYEDEHILVVNKHAGIVVHPAYNNWEDTLVNALAYHFGNLPSRDKGISTGLVHRLDKDTSGLILIAKNEQSMSSLAKQFHDHTIDRHYYTLVWGNVEQDNGVITANLSKSLHDRRVVVAGLEGKKAITHYKVIKRFTYVTLLECKLETGRTHQVRSHMKYIGHPIFADNLYGGLNILSGPSFAKYRAFIKNCFNIMPRQALHARLISFNHPITSKRLTFQSNLPDDFQSIINKWMNYNISQPSLLS